MSARRTNNDGEAPPFSSEAPPSRSARHDPERHLSPPFLLSLHRPFPVDLRAGSRCGRPRPGTPRASPQDPNSPAAGSHRYCSEANQVPRPLREALLFAFGHIHPLLSLLPAPQGQLLRHAFGGLCRFQADPRSFRGLFIDERGRLVS